MSIAVKVLIVEDSEDDTLLLLRELRRGGYEPTFQRVQSREAMVNALQSGPWDLVVADHSMPNFNTEAAMQVVRESGQDIPFIIVSGTMGEEEAVAAMKAGAQDYIMKHNVRRLLPAIERALQEAKVRRDHRQSQEALRESENLFRSLSSSSPLGILLTDTRGRCLYTNPRCRDIFDFGLLDSLDEGWKRIVALEDRAGVSEEWSGCVNEGREFSREFRIQTPHGSVRWVHLRASLLMTEDDRHTGYVATVEDITERKGLEDRLRQAQKMEAIGQLAGGVAHDFNNLLAAIIGFGELSLRKMDPTDPLYRNVAEMKKAGERAAGLTRQLLAFSRKQMLEPKVVNLNTIVGDLEKMLRRLIREDIELAFELAADLGHVKADPGQLEQVLMNLGVNARDAMPQGGRVTIQTANVHLNRESVQRYPDMGPGDYVQLLVRDTGTGMTDEVKAHLFEPFFTTKPQGQGTGLGLATCYGIIKQSDGHIVVESEPGQGTTFRIYLPRVQDQAEAHARPSYDVHLPRGTETVLLVEDEPTLREMASLVLSELGYRVIEAADGEDALRIAGEHRGDIHILITDVVMPRMGGKTLAELLKTRRSHLRVLFTSGYDESAIVQQGVIEPGIAFLQKPFTPTVLAHKVRDVLK